jgi:putative flippase GtrA
MDPVIQFCRSLAHKRVIRAIAVGAVAVAVQTAVFELLAVYLAILAPSTAVLIGAESGILTNFFLNNRFSFHDRRGSPLLPRLLRFHLVVSGSVTLQWLLIFIVERQTSDWYIIHAVYAMGIVIGFVFNYTGYRLWVWRHHGPPNA